MCERLRIEFDGGEQFEVLPLSEQSKFDQTSTVLLLEPPKEIQVPSNAADFVRESLKMYSNLEKVEPGRQAWVDSRKLGVIGPLEAGLNCQVIGPEFILV